MYFGEEKMNIGEDKKSDKTLHFLFLIKTAFIGEILKRNQHIHL